MVSKSEYLKFVKELVKDENNRDLGFLGENANKIITVFLTLAAISGVIAYITSSLNLENVEMISTAVAILFFSLTIGVFIRKTLVKERLKAQYFGKIFDFMLGENNYEFNQKECIPYNIYLDSKFPIGNNVDYSGRDMFSYSINDATQIHISDLWVKSSKGESNGTYFTGAFCYVEFNKDFKCHLTMNINTDDSLEKVELESMEFNDIFKVKSNNQIEARYILTPEVMEYFIKLSNRVKGLKVVFLNNRLYIGMNKDLFDIKDLEQRLEYVFEGVYDDLFTIMMIVEEINRNSKIFGI